MHNTPPCFPIRLRESVREYPSSLEKFPRDWEVPLSKRRCGRLEGVVGRSFQEDQIQELPSVSIQVCLQCRYLD